MTQTVPATAILGPGKTGLAIGLRVLNLDGTTYAAFSTTGVAETSTPGTYRKASGVVCPDEGGYIVFGTALVDYAEATVDSVYGLITGTKNTLDALQDLSQANVRTAVGLGAANLDTQLSAIDDYLDTEIAAIKAKTDLISASGTWTAVSAVNGSDITATIGASLAASVTSLTISATWTKMYLTIKTQQALAVADTYATLQVVVTNPAAAATDGTLYVSGAAASVAQRTQASLTVTQATGTVAIALDEALTAVFSEQNGLTYDLKELTSGGAANVVCTGVWNFQYTPTRATS